MKTPPLFLLLLLLPCLHLWCQAPFIQWSKCYGGEHEELAKAIIQTSDSGYVVVGATMSDGGDIPGHHGYADGYILRTDKNGNLKWHKAMGGAFVDYFMSVTETADGNFVITGFTASNDGDVAGHYGMVDRYDVWMVKVDGNGDLIWQKCLGGTEDDYGYSAKQTTDGGFIITGTTASNDIDVSGNHGTNGLGQNAPFEIWVVKTDSAANIEWQKCLGGTNYEVGEDIIETPEGDFVVVGSVISSNGDITGHHGGLYDWWVAKLDSVGNIKWQKCLGGNAQDYVSAICLSADGGYVITGESRSDNGDVQGNHKDSVLANYNNDFLTIKLDSAGNKVWQKCYGGSGNESARDIIEDEKGNYIITGEETSYDFDLASVGYHTMPNNWVICADSVGNIIWQKSMGGTAMDFGSAAKQTFDGGYVVAGESRSTDGYSAGCHGGVSDIWLIKLSFDSTVLNTTQPDLNLEIHIYPNPVTDFLSLEGPEGNNLVATLINYMGQTIAQKNVNGKSQLDMQSLPAGLYFMQFTDEKSMHVTRKVIKQ